MRDPNRLDAAYSQIAAIHKEHCPDLRIGQLLSNFATWLMKTKKVDIFFPEENQLVQYLEEYVEGTTYEQSGNIA